MYLHIYYASMKMDTELAKLAKKSLQASQNVTLSLVVGYILVCTNVFVHTYNVSLTFDVRLIHSYVLFLNLNMFQCRLVKGRIRVSSQFVHHQTQFNMKGYRVLIVYAYVSGIYMFGV